MSSVSYSTCRIQFIPTDRQRPERNYSDRSIVQLKQYDFGDYSLQALDIENNREEIFNIPFKEEDQYKRGKSANQPDEIRSKTGTYHLWLNASSRTIFHEALSQIFTEFKLIRPSDTSSIDSDQDDDSEDTNDDSDANNNGFNETPAPQINSPKDLLLDVHHLSTYIEQGHSDAAARQAAQLASKGVRLHVNSSNNTRNENEFTIQVQLDGNEYGIDQHGATIPVNVFSSTTVRELRAAFELAYQYVPTSQYFFVNGCLAHDISSMRDLNVGPNSLFVLFLLTHAKTFQRNGPWECPACETNNQQHNLRCVTCSAARTD